MKLKTIRRQFFGFSILFLILIIFAVYAWMYIYTYKKSSIHSIIEPSEEEKLSVMISGIKLPVNVDLEDKKKMISGIISAPQTKNTSSEGKEAMINSLRAN